jgi:hypothetical protein
MIEICPRPSDWANLHQKLLRIASYRKCTPPNPPKPLILSGWHYSNDIQKRDRWQQTVDWAKKNNCLELIAKIPSDNFHRVANPTDFQVGPLGGPMFRPWDSTSKAKPSADVLEKAIKTLRDHWPQIAGIYLAKLTCPQSIRGPKGRRLIVEVTGLGDAPWGTWSALSSERQKRHTSTEFRRAVNQAIAPHEVDHIDFVTVAGG